MVSVGTVVSGVVDCTTVSVVASGTNSPVVVAPITSIDHTPATFKYPLYSLRGDFAMARDVFTGRIPW